MLAGWDQISLKSALRLWNILEYHAALIEGKQKIQYIQYLTMFYINEANTQHSLQVR